MKKLHTGKIKSTNFDKITSKAKESIANLGIKFYRKVLRTIFSPNM